MIYSLRPSLIFYNQVTVVKILRRSLNFLSDLLKNGFVLKRRINDWLVLDFLIKNLDFFWIFFIKPRLNSWLIKMHHGTKKATWGRLKYLRQIRSWFLNIVKRSRERLDYYSTTFWNQKGQYFLEIFTGFVDCRFQCKPLLECLVWKIFLD